jgi:hypothetical protein
LGEFTGGNTGLRPRCVSSYLINYRDTVQKLTIESWKPRLTASTHTYIRTQKHAQTSVCGAHTSKRVTPTQNCNCGTMATNSHRTLGSKRRPCPSCCQRGCPPGFQPQFGRRRVSRSARPSVRSLVRTSQHHQDEFHTCHKEGFRFGIV